MKRTTFTLAGVLAAVAFAAVAAGSSAAGSAATSPAASPAEMLTASVMSGSITVDIQAQRGANMPADSATGVFTAHSMIGTRFTLHGPVTCLDVRDNKAGLFYPITASDPPLFAKLRSGVFIYLQVNSAGKPTMLGFVPVPFSHTTSCPPRLALLPVTSGTATLVP